MAETAGTVDVRRDGDVAVVTLRRERKLNALSAHMETELLQALRSPRGASSRAVVVTGGAASSRRARTSPNCGR